MSEQMPGSTVIDQQAMNPERFQGVPTDVPFQGIEYVVPDIQKDMWQPGVIDSNGGLVAAHDADKPVIHIAPQGDRDKFTGYEAGQATVPLTGSDQDGWRGGRFSRDVASMGVNEVARSKGVKGRTILTEDGRHEMFTANPFDKGDFVDMSGVIEKTPAGEEIKNRRDLVTEISSSKSTIGNEEVSNVGSFNTNNGVLSWVTPDGKVQIAPVDDEKIVRLTKLGYEQGEIAVPHSNGESFTPDQAGTGQVYGEMEMAKMQAAGQTMTPEERNVRFSGVTIPGRYLGLVK